MICLDEATDHSLIPRLCKACVSNCITCKITIVATVATSFCHACSPTYKLVYNYTACTTNCHTYSTDLYTNYNKTHCIIKCDDSTGANHNDLALYYDDIDYKCVVVCREGYYSYINTTDTANVNFDHCLQCLLLTNYDQCKICRYLIAPAVTVEVIQCSLC